MKHSSLWLSDNWCKMWRDSSPAQKLCSFLYPYGQKIHIIYHSNESTNSHTIQYTNTIIIICYKIKQLLWDRSYKKNFENWKNIRRCLPARLLCFLWSSRFTKRLWRTPSRALGQVKNLLMFLLVQDWSQGWEEESSLQMFNIISCHYIHKTIWIFTWHDIDEKKSIFL